MCRQADARVVATAPRSADRVHSVGADEVIDYRQGVVRAEAMRLTHGRGVDAVIDLVSADSATAPRPLLRHNGEMVCVVGRPQDNNLTPWGKAISLHDAALGFACQHGDADNLHDIARRRNLGSIDCGRTHRSADYPHNFARR